MQNQLSNLVDFISFTHDIRAVKRAMWVKDEEQFENDSEHCYQVALCSLYIIEAQHLELDVFRCMGMGIVHDILEVYAGDTPVFGSDEALASKAAREQAALARLKQTWPEQVRMHALIDEYEARQTPESTFVYALDKLLPIINNYLDNGRNWKAHNRTLEEVMAAKAGKVTLDPTIAQYYEAITAVLKTKPELFTK